MNRHTATKIPSEPQSLKEIEDLKKDKLKTLSLNFELDLIRLSKTIKLISQTEKISNDYVVSLENSLSEFQENLATLVKKSLDLEEETSEPSLKPVETNDERGEKLNRCIREMTAIINGHLHYSRKVKDDLEKKTKEYINKLDPTRRLYKKELEELHSRLTQQQNNLSNALFDISILDDKKLTVSDKSEAPAPKEKKPPDKPAKSTSPSSKHLQKTSIKSPMNYAIKHKEITYLIMLVVFVFLFLKFFNDGRDSQESEISSKSETVYSWEISKKEAQRQKESSHIDAEETKNAESVEEIIKEIKYEILKTDPSKSAIERETIEEPPSEKRILALTVPAVNLRKGPNKKYPVSSVVKSGEEVEKIGESGNWIKIKTESGDEGWIWKRLVRGKFE